MAPAAEPDSRWRALASLLAAAGGAVAVRLALAALGAGDALLWRPEVSTPANSLLQAREGVRLLRLGLSPYAGASCHAPPLWLALVAPLSPPPPAWWPALELLPHVACDLVGAAALWAAARALHARAPHWATHDREAPWLSARQLALAYLWHPLGVLTCAAGASTCLDNAALMLAVAGGAARSAPLAAFGVAAGAYAGLHPLLLLVPLAALMRRGPEDVLQRVPWPGGDVAASASASGASDGGGGGQQQQKRTLVSRQRGAQAGDGDGDDEDTQQLEEGEEEEEEDGNGEAAAAAKPATRGRAAAGAVRRRRQGAATAAAAANGNDDEDDDGGISDAAEAEQQQQRRRGRRRGRQVATRRSQSRSRSRAAAGAAARSAKAAAAAAAAAAGPEPPRGAAWPLLAATLLWGAALVALSDLAVAGHAGAACGPRALAWLRRALDGGSSAATTTTTTCWAARVYGLHLGFKDLTPNLGLFWYFFTEMFAGFRAFFLFTFHSFAPLLAAPLALRFPRRPLAVLWALLFVSAMFRPYAAAGDAVAWSAALPLLMQQQLGALPAGGFFAGSLLLLAVLAPSMWHQWIVLDAANANFLFSITLLLGVWATLFLGQLLRATALAERALAGKGVRRGGG